MIVTNPDQQFSSTTANTKFTYEAAPVVSAISPTGGVTTGGTSVTIGGANFFQAPFSSPPTVNICGANAAILGGTAQAPTLTCTTAAGSGAVSVIVTNPDGQASTPAASPVQFTFGSAPTISSVTPRGGSISSATTFTITGTNFNSPTVTIDGITAAFTAPAPTGTTLTVFSPNPHSTPGTVVVVVKNPDGQNVTGGFTYRPDPTVTSVQFAPNGTQLGNAGPIAGGSVQILGTNFVTDVSQAAQLSVLFGGNTATGCSVISSSQINCTAPACTAAGCVAPTEVAATVSVVVTFDQQTVTATNAYTYQPPPPSPPSSRSPSAGRRSEARGLSTGRPSARHRHRLRGHSNR